MVCLKSKMKNNEVQKKVGNLTKKCETAESWQDYFVYMYIDVKRRPPSLLGILGSFL